MNPIFSFSFDTRENFYLSRYKKISFQYYLDIYQFLFCEFRFPWKIRYKITRKIKKNISIHQHSDNFPMRDLFSSRDSIHRDLCASEFSHGLQCHWNSWREANRTKIQLACVFLRSFSRLHTFLPMLLLLPSLKKAISRILSSLLFVLHHDCIISVNLYNDVRPMTF